MLALWGKVLFLAPLYQQVPKVPLSANSADTLQPYEPGKVIGSLDPTLPMPANKDKCGGMGVSSFSVQ